MRKDIRHYDMKEVKFEPDATDRRFLTLEVSTNQYKEKVTQEKV